MWLKSNLWKSTLTKTSPPNKWRFGYKGRNSGKFDHLAGGGDPGMWGMEPGYESYETKGVWVANSTNQIASSGANRERSPVAPHPTPTQLPTIPDDARSAYYNYSEIGQAPAQVCAVFTFVEQTMYGAHFRFDSALAKTPILIDSGASLSAEG